MSLEKVAELLSPFHISGVNEMKSELLDCSVKGLRVLEIYHF